MQRTDNKRSRRRSGGTFSRGTEGFTFVEIVVALAIGAAVIVAAVMAFGAVNSQGLSRRQVTVDIGINNAFAFYGWTDAKAAVSEAPSFAATAMANSLRDQFLDDVSAATAVVCLARNKPNTFRPTNFAIPASLDARTLLTPENFRTNLIDTNGTIYTNFSTNSFGNGATTATNLSVYMLYAADNMTNVTVDAIYESDFVPCTNPNGTYATVRRYVGTNMTGYYHVFYPDVTNNVYTRPRAAFFSRSAGSGGDSRYRQAENRPFYFMWWPDPSTRDLASDYPTETNSPSGARADYMQQSGATSFFFTFPAFPPL